MKTLIGLLLAVALVMVVGKVQFFPYFPFVKFRALWNLIGWLGLMIAITGFYRQGYSDGVKLGREYGYYDGLKKANTDILDIIKNKQKENGKETYSKSIGDRQDC